MRYPAWATSLLQDSERIITLSELNSNLMRPFFPLLSNPSAILSDWEHE